MERWELNRRENIARKGKTRKMQIEKERQKQDVLDRYWRTIVAEGDPRGSAENKMGVEWEN